jgi:hypothetical protein
VGNIPEGAQRSEDGHWWWDDQGQEWKAVDQADQAGQQNGAADPNQAATAPNQSTGADGAAAADGGAAAGTSDPERAAARQSMGLPANNVDATDEQRQPYLGQAQVEVHPVEADQVEVVAMADSGSGNGESVA